MLRPIFGRFSILCLCLIVSPLLEGCGGDSESDDAGPTFNRDACASLVAPQRMGFRWETLNHRVSLWSVGLERDGCKPRSLEAGVVGGNFSTGEGPAISDTPSLKYGFQSYRADSPDPIGVAHRTFASTLGDTRQVEKTVTFQRESLELEHYERIVPILEGFEFRTDVEQSDTYAEDYNPARGYTLAGIGVSVEVVEQSSSRVHLRYRIRFQPGASADRLEHNRAVPKARIGARLEVALIGTPSGRVRTGSTDYELAYEKPEPGEESLERPSAEQARIELSGQSGGPRGFWGLQRFDVQLEADVTCDRNGDCPKGDTCQQSSSQCRQTFGPPGFYMRELTVDLTRESYDAETGRAAFQLEGFASNTSDFVSFYSLRSQVSGRMAWFQVGGAGEPRRFERTFETGRTSFDWASLP